MTTTTKTKTTHAVKIAERAAIEAEQAFEDALAEVNSAQEVLAIAQERLFEAQLALTRTQLAAE